MVTVRITPYCNDYVGEVEIFGKELSKEEIKEIQYKLNTYWIGEDDYEMCLKRRIEDYDDDLCIVEFPKSCFIQNNGGYDFADVIETIVNPLDNVVLEQISSVIDDVETIQWVLEEELEYWAEMDDYETQIKETVRKVYANAFVDDLDKIDYISSVIWGIYENKPIDSFRGDYQMATLDAIEDEADGWLYIFSDPHSLIEDDYSVFDWTEEEKSISKEKIKFLQTIIEYAENGQYDDAIQYIEREMVQ